MSASENPEQKSAETPEERKERLKSLAKARVERLMADNADDVVRPHIDSTGRRDLAEASNNSGPVKSSTERLVEDGFLEISIRAHNVKVTKAELTTLPTAEVMHFKVDVDGVELDDPLVCVRSREFTVFSIKAPKHYTNMLLSDEIRNTYPLAVLRALIDNSWFASYLLTEVVEKRNRALRIQEILGRITEETERFRDVLLRKYKQLTYIDEYETLEAARFKDELGRFATKRLHDIQDIPASTVVELIFDRVSQWASEDDSSSEKTLFDPNMSPIDYERFCAERFAALGWVTRLTKSSGDQGADLICEANHRRLVVQCKLYSGSVGNAAVQEAIAAREYEYADLAAVVSNGPFTTSAKELASAAHVLLLHHDEIALVLP